MQKQKEMLIEMLIQQGYLHTPRIIAAFRKVPREDFVLPQYKKQAYINQPLPISGGQTISQPLTVAAMTEALQPKEGHKILEVGTGSGYQAAILNEVVGPKGKIVTTERISELVDFAKNNFSKNKCYKNVEIVHHDGSKGYRKEAPYDRIIVTASAPKLPPALLKQLKEDGKIVIPIGDEIFVIDKSSKKSIGHYIFVPLLGKYGHLK